MIGGTFCRYCRKRITLFVVHPNGPRCYPNCKEYDEALVYATASGTAPVPAVEVLQDKDPAASPPPEPAP